MPASLILYPPYEPHPPLFEGNDIGLCESTAKWHKRSVANRQTPSLHSLYGWKQQEASGCVIARSESAKFLQSTVVGLLHV